MRILKTKDGQIVGGLDKTGRYNVRLDGAMGKAWKSFIIHGESSGQVDLTMDIFPGREALEAVLGFKRPVVAIGFIVPFGDGRVRFFSLPTDELPGVSFNTLKKFEKIGLVRFQSIRHGGSKPTAFQAVDEVS